MPEGRMGLGSGLPLCPCPMHTGMLLAPPPRAVLGAHQQCLDPSFSTTSSTVGGAQGGSERCHQPLVAMGTSRHRSSSCPTLGMGSVGL